MVLWTDRLFMQRVMATIVGSRSQEGAELVIDSDYTTFRSLMPCTSNSIFAYAFVRIAVQLTCICCHFLKERSGELTGRFLCHGTTSEVLSVSANLLLSEPGWAASRHQSVASSWTFLPLPSTLSTFDSLYLPGLPLKRPILSRNQRWNDCLNHRRSRQRVVTPSHFLSHSRINTRSPAASSASHSCFSPLETRTMSFPSSPPSLPEEVFNDPPSSPPLPPAQFPTRKRHADCESSLSSDPIFSEDASEESDFNGVKRKRQYKGPWFHLPSVRAEMVASGSGTRNSDSGVWMGSDASDSSVGSGRMQALSFQDFLVKRAPTRTRASPQKKKPTAEQLALGVVDRALDASQQTVDLS